MSQVFNLRLATQTLMTDAQQLGVTPEQLQNISITVRASLIQQPEPQLQLSYAVQLPDVNLAAKLNWPKWTTEQVRCTDYLWQQTCLECFISGHATTTDCHVNNGYIEINVSPSGSYALYQFDDYRQPKTLPPPSLLKAASNIRADITWDNQSSFADAIKTPELSPVSNSAIIDSPFSTLTFSSRYCYQRSFGLALEQLPTKLFTESCSTNKAIELLHPCVILYFGEVALYFATKHALPADFHQRRYWTPFKT